MTEVSSAPRARPTTATTAPSSTTPRTPVTAGHVAERVGDGLAGGLGAQGRFERLAHVGDRERVQHGDGLGRRGLLRARGRAAQARSSSGVVSAPGARVTNATGTSPAWTSGRPTACARGDRGVCQQRVLDDRGVDVVAAADDQVLGAAGEVDEAVLVDPGEVAGVQPAVAQLAQPVQHAARPGPGRPRSRGTRSARRWRAPRPHRSAGRPRSPSAVDLDGLHLLVGQPLADGPGTRVVREAQRADAGGLGEAVALDQADAGGGLEVVPDRRRQG